MLAAGSGVLLWAVGVAVEVVHLARSFDGICPAQPTDIPARPCTREEFLAENTYAGWGALGFMLVLIVAVTLTTTLWSAWVGFRPRPVAEVSRAARWVHRGVAVVGGLFLLAQAVMFLG